MRVLHVELPRGLTLAVRPWRADLHARLLFEGHESAQLDLNGPFWRWVLADDETDAFGRLLDLGVQPPSFNRAHLERVVALARAQPVPGARLGLAGLSLDGTLLDDTRALAAWADSEPVFAWLCGLVERVPALAEAWSLVTMSVGSNEELALGAALSAALRRLHPETHVALAYHQWENYTLAPRLERLATEGALLELFDSAVVHGEWAPEAVAGLAAVLSGAPLDRLVDTVTRVDGTARVFARPARQEPRTEPYPPALDAAIEAYLDATTLPRHRIFLLDALVRNDCYFGACTFCAQNTGYVRHQHYKVEPELTRAAAMMERFAGRSGVRAFGFVDQAIPPRVLEDFVARLEPLGLGARWCGRMLFDAGLDDALLARAAAAGLRELLFGLETLSEATLVRIGKGPTRLTAEGLDSLLCRLARHGIDATLNFIFGLPTQTDEDFLATTAPAIAAARARHAHVTVILNAFELFDGTPMARSPAQHGLVEVRRRPGDLVQSLDYLDVERREGPRLLPATLATLAAGSPLEGLRAADHAEVALLGYTSVGLLHRWETGRWLLEELREAGRAPAAPFGARDELVLGANGYLGHNLALRLDPSRLILSARGPASLTPVAAPYFAAELTRSAARLRELSPRVVWVTARPVTEGFDEELTFLATLQSLLFQWAERGSLQRLILFSTQLVCATPASGAELVHGATPAAPEAPYELAKSQLELFGAFLARRFRIAVDVVRLPLLSGGRLLPRHRDAQLVARWTDALDAGARWRFDGPESETFGNSWVHVEDLIDALARESPPPGYRSRTAKSGDFTYAELQARWPALAGPAQETLPLVRSAFFVKDELGLPARRCGDLVGRSTIEGPHGGLRSPLVHEGAMEA